MDAGSVRGENGGVEKPPGSAAEGSAMARVREREWKTKDSHNDTTMQS